MNLIKTKIKYYRYDISKDTEKAKYNKLCKELQKTRNLFDCISLTNYEQKTNFFNKIKALEKKGFIELETKFIFNDQWNTNKENFNLRVLDWNEEIHPNKDRKEGYYLEITKEMQDIRRNTFKCGFCGKQYLNPKIKFCKDCLDSEFLKVEELRLLRLKNVSDKTGIKPLTTEELNKLMPIYKKAQIEGTTERGKARIKGLRDNLYKEMIDTRKKATIKHNGFIWLLDKGINTNNCIYYEHTNIFSFGWRNPIDKAIIEDLRKELKDFPYAFEIK